MHWLAKQGLTKWILFFFATIISFILKIKGESSMKKEKISIMYLLFKFVGEISNQISINLVETALLANALYKFFHYENK